MKAAPSAAVAEIFTLVPASTSPPPDALSQVPLATVIVYLSLLQFAVTVQFEVADAVVELDDELPTEQPEPAVQPVKLALSGAVAEMLNALPPAVYVPLPDALSQVPLATVIVY